MKRLVLLCMLLCACAPAWAQLTLVGGCAATATSCTPATIGGHSFAAGQFQYTFAMRTATTAPTLPGTFTALDTASASSSSFRSGCLVMTSSAPDSSAWTNATRVMTLIYSGTAATATANCVTAGVGFHTSSGTSGTTSTVTVTGGTLANTGGTSVVIGAVGSSAATCLPPAFPSQETTTNGAIGDLEGASSYSTSTCTGSTGNWKSDTVELLAAPVATPTSSPGAGTYTSTQTVTLSDATSGASIVYCTDSPGTCTPSTAYTGSFTVSSTSHVRAKATKSGMPTSAVLDDFYSICTPNCPTLVQDVLWGTNSTKAVNGWVYKLPNPTLGGSNTQGDSSNNTLIMTISWSGTTTISTLTDDGPGGGNTWAVGPSCSDGGSPRRNIQIRYVSGIKQGTQTFTLAFSGNTSDVISRFSEYGNVGVADGTSCTATSLSGPTITAGSITPTVPGDLIYHVGVDAGGAGGDNPVTNYVVGSGFRLLPSERMIPNFAQWISYGSTAAINPTMTATGNTDAWLSAAIAFKSAAAGTAPSATAIRIMREWHFRDENATSGANFVVQWPCYGNLSVLLNGEGPTYHTLDATTPVSDSDGNTFTKVSASTLYPYIFYGANQTCSSPNTRTVTLKNGTANLGSPGTWVFYDIINAATSPYDTSGSTYYAQTAKGASTCDTAANSDTDHAPDITPTVAPGLAFAVTNEGEGPICSLRTPATYTFDSAWATGITDDSSALDNANGHGHVYYSNTSTLDFHWGWANPAASAATNGFALAATFKQAAASAVRKRRVSVNVR